MKVRLRKRGGSDLLNVTDFEVGDRVVVNHPEIGVPVGGEITAIVPRAQGVMVRFDGITQVALVPVGMLERP